jgi:hypothetical protein
LVVVALVLMTGLHWAALQTVAWTTMLAGDLCCEHFSQAVNHTFDGRHPCCLCKAIAAAQKNQKKSEAAASSLKMEFPLANKTWRPVPPGRFEMLFAADRFADALPSKPLLPPPRPLTA